ncbi:MAG TPA: hypothetical protein VGW98_03130 [Solirubrobacteraceae bacterium]|nr:hypothetical protein [Solirubrobacteraceae bacterium]
MKSILSRKLVIGATGLLLLGGAGGAVAATQSSGGPGRRAYIDDVAKRLNVSPGALTAALKGAADEQIETAVAAGRIKRSQADALKQRIDNGGGIPFFGHRFGAGGLGGHGAAARYLGIGADTLRNDLESGRSLAQIASSTPGKSVEGLKAAILSAKKKRLDQAVSSGSITSQQERERLTRLSSRMEALLQRTGAGGPSGAPGSPPLGHQRRPAAPGAP